MRNIVEGETRFSKIGNFKEPGPGDAIDLKALDLQQLFLAMTEEVRQLPPLHCVKELNLDQVWQLAMATALCTASIELQYCI